MALLEDRIMKDKRFFAFLIAVTIIVSALGTVLVSKTMTDFSGVSYVGAVTGTSQTSVTVIGAAAVSVAPSSINFGNVKVTGGFTGANCTFQTTGDAYIKNNGCDTGPDDAANPGFINISNIGSVALNVSINATANATVFLGNYTGAPAVDPLFQMNVTDTTDADSCGIGLSGAAVMLDLNASEDGEGAGVVCQYLQSNASYNKINVGLNLRIPIESQPTSKAATVKVFAAEVA